MKYLFLSFLVLLMGCGKVVNDFAKLPQAEKDALIAQGFTKCMEGSNAAFQEFKDESNASIDGFVRGQNWLYEMKTGASVFERLRFTVWKQITNGVIFVVSDEKPTNSATTYSFLKIEDTTNTEMITDLQIARCTVLAGRSISNNSSSVTYGLTSIGVAGANKKKTTSTYTFGFANLALFGSYGFTRNIQYLDLNENPVSTPVAENYTGTFVRQSPDIVQFNTFGEYPAGTKFCVIKEGAANTFSFPYTIFSDSDTTICTSSATVGPTGGPGVTWANPSLDL